MQAPVAPQAGGAQGPTAPQASGALEEVWLAKRSDEGLGRWVEVEESADEFQIELSCEEGDTENQAFYEGLLRNIAAGCLG